MIPIGEWATKRLKNLSKTDKIRDESKVQSGFGKNVSNWLGRDMVYPTNVIHIATECANVNHSAAFPTSLPSWFIKLFTKEGDIVLDPFMGSGSTALAAINLNRHFLGTESHKEYYEIALQRIKQIGRRTQKTKNYSIIKQKRKTINAKNS